MHFRLAWSIEVVASRLAILLARDFLFFRACGVGLLALSARAVPSPVKSASRHVGLDYPPPICAAYLETESICEIEKRNRVASSPYRSSRLSKMPITRTLAGRWCLRILFRFLPLGSDA